MRYELIKTENYLFILSDEEIKMNNYYYSFTERTIDRNYGNINEDDSVIEYELKKIIAHLPLNNSPILEGVDLLPPLEDEVENKYTEEDMRNEILRAFIHGQGNAQMMEAGLERDETADYTNYRIKSLQQQKLPIAFECETQWVGKYIY